MRTIRGILAFLTIWWIARVAGADGLLYQLPMDGTWATYDVVVKTRIDGHDMNIRQKWRIASVGNVSEGGEPCRWIEFKKDTKIESEFFPHTDHEAWTLLFPVKYLAKGESPMAHFLRGWHQFEKYAPEKITKPVEGRSTLLRLILSGPVKDTRKLEPVEVTSKLGKLSCEGVQGTVEVVLKTGIKSKNTFMNRLHPRSPFGVVAGHWALDRSGEETNSPPATLEITLADFGDNASRQIPNEK